MTIVCATIAMGCTHIDTAKSIDVDLNAPKEEIPIYEIYDSVTFIPLETTTESLVKLGLDASVAIADSFIFIANTIENRVQMFDHKGKYLRTIGIVGQDSGEYCPITQIDYNPTDKTLLVFDGRSGNVQRYSANGDYLMTDTIGCYADDFAFSDGNYVFADYTSTSGNGPAIYLYSPISKEKKIISDWHPKWNISWKKQMYRHNGKITIPGPFPGYDIYELKGDSLIHTYQFNVTPEITNDDVNFRLHICDPTLSGYLIENIAESDGYILLYCYNFGQQIHVLFNKSTGTYRLFENMLYDFGEYEIYWPTPISYHNARIGFMSKHNSKDNPILALFHCKRPYVSR